MHLRDAGVRHDLISAVFAAGGDDDLVRLLARVEALRAFLGPRTGLICSLPCAAPATSCGSRKSAIGRSYAGEPDRQRLHAPEEQDLFFRLMSVSDDIVGALEREAFGEAMTALASLRQPVDAFFDRVTVNANEPEVRENRLYLLNQIRSALSAVADFSLIEDTVQSAEGKRRVA